MNSSEIKIFLITPKQSEYKTFIVYADSEEEARCDASVKINLMRKTTPNTSTKQLDATYLDENLSTCCKVDATTVDVQDKMVIIKYSGNEYTLYKNHAVELKLSDSSTK